MIIHLLSQEFVICKVRDVSEINFNDSFIFYAKTDDEISLVCEIKETPKNLIDIEKGWKALKICGILDFSLIGIISKLTGLLADNQIGVFVISTFNTDYILIKDKEVEKTVKILSDNGYDICEPI